MSSTDRQVDFDLERRLADVNLSPGERADALAAAERAEILVSTVEVGSPRVVFADVVVAHRRAG